MQIEVRQLSNSAMQERDVLNWPIWEKEVSRFPWSYQETEECYLLEGKVVIETADGKKVRFGKGDFVRFPQGLKCTWDVQEPVRKHYNFP